MDVEQIIYNLHTAKTGSTLLDDQISGALGEGLTNNLSPNYTTNLQQAANLAKKIYPDAALALTWGKGKGSAQFEGHAVVEAKSPHLAVCIAAMMILARNWE